MQTILIWFLSNSLVGNQGAARAGSSGVPSPAGIGLYLTGFLIARVSNFSEYFLGGSC